MGAVIILAAARIGAVLDLPVYRNTVALAVHALRIAHIVALLADVTRSAGGTCSNQTSGYQAGACSNSSASSPSQCCACCRP